MTKFAFWFKQFSKIITVGYIASFMNILPATKTYPVNLVKVVAAIQLSRVTYMVNEKQELIVNLTSLKQSQAKG